MIGQQGISVNRRRRPADKPCAPADREAWSNRPEHGITQT